MHRLPVYAMESCGRPAIAEIILVYSKLHTRSKQNDASMLKAFHAELALHSMTSDLAQQQRRHRAEPHEL